MNKVIMIMGCLMFLSSCAVESLHHVFDVEKKFPRKYAGSILSAPESQLHWQDSFPSKKLQKDIVRLSSGNHEMEAAMARVKQAVAGHNISHSSLLPSIDAGANFSRSKISNNTGENRYGTGNIFSFAGIMNWEPDVWGKLRTKEKASALNVREKEALADRKLMDLRNLLVRSWITFHASKRLEKLLEEQQKTNIRFLDLTRMYFEQGQGSALDIMQQQGRLIATEKALPEIFLKKQRAASTYAVLMGYFPDGEEPAYEELPSINKLPRISTPDELFRNRPDLKACFMALQAADYNLAASVAERLPRLSLGISYDKSRAGFSSVETETVLSLTGGLLAPLFDAGRLKAKMNQRKAEAEESLAILEQAVLEAVREVQDAIACEASLFERQNILGREKSNAVRTLENAKQLYINGKGLYLSVLSSLIDLQNIEIQEIELQEELLINRCNLLSALGVKWSNENEKY